MGPRFSLNTFVFSLLFTTSLLATGIESQKVSVLKILSDFSVIIENSETDFPAFEAKLNTLFSSLENIDVTKIDLDEVRRNTNLIVRNTAEFDRQIVQLISKWKESGHWTKKSETTVRNTIRGLRYFGDSVGEMSLSLGDSKSPVFNFKTFYGGEPFVITADGQHFDPLQNFRPGDLVLMRGSSEVSAAIARVADVNTQFSHIAIVTQDPVSKELFLQEALIEKGLVLSPIKSLVDHAIGRAVVLRHEDPVRAEQASRSAWKRSHDGQKYIYDFSMKYKISPQELSENPELFCSLVVRDAFYGDEKAPYLLPKDPSQLSPKNREFLKLIGISDSTTDIFAPSDIELDPDFIKVAEFRDFSKTPQQRVYDVIFDKVFAWMDEGGHFQKSKLLDLIANLGFQISKIEPVKKLLWKFGVPVAPHVKPNVLRAVVSIGLIRMHLQKELQPKIDAFVKKNGVVPTPQTLENWLEKIRDKGTNKAFKTLKLGPRKTANSCLKFYK
ncbi:MAG: hypothetical protein B7Y39_19380 [Bdellovibrio sp. 28-41-41]|nr:MAG: hypothetical protein B7Y39_19380 [Bdellovibrio sp. 28-41-41]